MPRVTFQSIDELESRVGQEVVVTDWTEITQARINQFAEATGDFQWIHVDVERATRESPFGAPIAHGYLTLSLLAKMAQESLDFPFSRMGVNYGLNRVRFPSPVPVGSRVRGRFTLAKLERFDGGVQMIWQVTMERDGGDKPVMIAESVSRRYV